MFESCKRRFPTCLDGAPLLMPADDSAVGQRLRAWLQARSLHPRVVGECDDSALAKEFGRRGMGIFVGPTVLERDIEKTVPDKKKEVIFYCGGGYRSVLAAEVAQRMGYTNVSSLIGGYKGLLAANWALKKDI